jgi:hypothetical protein
MELMITAGILSFVIAGLLLVYVNTVVLNELHRNMFVGFNALQVRMEELKSKSFAQLCTGSGSCPAGGVTNNSSFTLNGFSGNAIGKAYISLISPSVKQVTLNACFMSRRRLIGDSLTNCYSSPVQITTFVFGQ